MELQVDIAFDQLVKLARQLPPTQWAKLKIKVEKEKMEQITLQTLKLFFCLRRLSIKTI